MKKQIILAALAVVAMTSCSNNESVEPASTSKIGFTDSYLAKGAVSSGAFDILAYKGADETTATTILKDAKASDTYTLGSGFASANYYYDGYVASNYYFYGYGKMVSADLAKVDAANTLAGKVLTYTVPATANEDLVSARLNVKGNISGLQTLAFYHALAKVRFTITKGADVQNAMVVSKIEYTVDNNKGTLNLATETGADRVVAVDASGTTATYVLAQTLTLDGTVQDAAGLLYVIPQTLADGKITVTYTVDGGDPQTKEFTGLTTTLEGGKGVKYALTLTLNKIELNASDEAWGADVDL